MRYVIVLLLRTRPRTRTTEQDCLEQFGLNQPCKNFIRNFLANVRISFDQTRDIGEILLALAGSTRSVESHPNFALKDIFKAGDGQSNA